MKDIAELFGIDFDLHLAQFTERITMKTTTALSALVALVLFAAPALAQQPPRITVEIGAPAANGQVGIAVHAFRPPNYDGIRFKRVASILATDTAQQKAQKIVTALGKGAAGKALTARVLPGTPPVIEIQGKDGWQVTSNSRIVSDRTQERNKMRFHRQRAGSHAVLSLSGVATGQDGLGLPGCVTVEAGPLLIYLPTTPGMTAAQLESDLCTQLNSRGLVSWIATPNDAVGGLTVLTDTDGGAVFLAAMMGDDALGVEVRDNGLEMEAMCVLDPNEAPRPYGHELLLGDCGGDGTVSIVDALQMSRIAAGLDMSPIPGDYAFDSCNTDGYTVPDPGATINILDALALAQELVATPPAPGCPCDVPAEWLTPPPAPAGYRYVGRSVVVDFVLVETTYSLTRVDQPTDITHIRSSTEVVGGVLCCDIIVAHLFEPIP